MIKRLHIAMIIVCLGVCHQTMAQGGLSSFVRKVGTMLDTMAVRGVDRRYIDAPEKPWQFLT